MAGLLSGFFKRKDDQPGTGIYRFSNGTLDQLAERPGNGSINAIVEFLGYQAEQVHTVFAVDSLDIECLGVKVFTSQLVYVLAKDKKRTITYPMAKKALGKIDWNFEYSEHFLDTMFEDGIVSGSFTLDFLKSVVNLEKQNDWLYLAPDLQVYLSFNGENILESYSSSEWAQPEAKWLQKINSEMYDGYYKDALKNHKEEISAMEEVNLKCRAIWKTPEATNNVFVPLHSSSSGTVNYYNLMVAHYNERVDIGEFKMVNKGRFTMLGES